MHLYLEHERLCIHYVSVKSWPINLNTDRFLGIKCTTNKQNNKQNKRGVISVQGSTLYYL